MQVMDTVENDGFSGTAWAAIYDDCKILWSRFDSASLEHCNREPN
jgi:hypothetical protein